MTIRTSRFDTPRRLAELSAEGQELVLDARERLEAWIDENVDRLEQEAQASVEEKRRALADEVAAFQEEIAASRQAFAEMLDRLGGLEADFEAGDGVTVDQAVRATRETVMALRTALQERERRVARLPRTGASPVAGESRN